LKPSFGTDHADQYRAGRRRRHHVASPARVSSAPSPSPAAIIKPLEVALATGVVLLLDGEATIVAGGMVTGEAASGGTAGRTTAVIAAAVTAALVVAACRAAVVDVVGCLALPLVAGATIDRAGCDDPEVPPALVADGVAAGGRAIIALFAWWWPLPPITGG
jgi:hypothetical protein